LEPNAFRNDGQTMQARIEAMKEQNWSDSNEFLKVQLGACWSIFVEAEREWYSPLKRIF
jgi:hypothetical protein